MGFEGFAWLIPLWVAHINALLGSGLAAACWIRHGKYTKSHESPRFSGPPWLFTVAIGLNVVYVALLWGLGRSSPFLREILGVRVGIILLCLCILLSIVFLFISFIRSSLAKDTTMRLIKLSSAFLAFANLAGVVLFVVAIYEN